MLWTTKFENRFEAFWDWFKVREETYWDLQLADRDKELDNLTKRLQRVNPHISCKICGELTNGKRQLVLSAEGKVEAFDDVLNLEMAAPELQKFEINSCCQSISEGVEVITDLSFLPPTLKRLKSFDEVLHRDGKSLDEYMGLHWIDDTKAYQQTPLDVLPFMGTGVDGIHIGLLTDFGKVTDLEQAFIVSISPMDFENEVKLLARNAKEFIDYLYSDEELLFLFNGSMLESIDDYQIMKQNAEKDASTETDFYRVRKEVAAKLQEVMGCVDIANVYEYIQKTVTASRSTQVVLPTMDGLGIAATENIADHSPLFPLTRNEDPALEEIMTFFVSAPKESKLALIRDVQFTGLVFEDPELKAFLIEELKEMGCCKEAERLVSLNW